MVLLSYDEYDALTANLDKVSQLGFEIEPDVAPTVAVKGVPIILGDDNPADIISDLAKNFIENKLNPQIELFDDLYHSYRLQSGNKGERYQQRNRIAGARERRLWSGKYQILPSWQTCYDNPHQKRYRKAVQTSSIKMQEAKAMENKIPLLVIARPTASGKTACAVELAKIYDGEIVSADSMQIYKDLSIATAKPTKEEMQGVPHYLVDFLEPEQLFPWQIM